MNGARTLLRTILGRARGTLISGVEPYLFVEQHVEARFWKYIGIRPREVRSIIIAGAWHGTEIGALLHRYPRAEVVAFEPSPRNYAILQASFGAAPRVTCFREAISDTVGHADFHEGSLPGTGSLLHFGETEESRQHNSGLVETEEFRVPVSTLDDHEGVRHLERVDLLKIDVQGGELAAIGGGAEMLKRTSAVLIEVALMGSAYQGASRFGAVTEALADAGLTLCGLGLDPVTLDGNALYARVHQADPRSA